MTSHDIKRRAAERPAFCRGCDKQINKGEDMIATYSFRNTGMWIYFCLDCGKEIGKLTKGDNDE